MKIVVVGVPRRELEEALDKAVLYGMSGAKIKEAYLLEPPPTEMIQKLIEPGGEGNDTKAGVAGHSHNHPGREINQGRPRGGPS